jgi:hypothetical protein
LLIRWVDLLTVKTADKMVAMNTVMIAEMMAKRTAVEMGA